MTLMQRSSSWWLAASLILPACTSRGQSTDPEAGSFDGYYSEKGTAPGTDAGGSGGSSDAPRGPAKVRSMSSTRGAKVVKAIKARKPPAGAGKRPTKPTQEETGPGIAITGILPTLTAVGSHVEILGQHLDDAALEVRVGGTVQTIVSREADRAVIKVSGKGGPVSVGRTVKGKFKESDRTELSLAVLANDGGFGKPRTQPEQGLVGNLYAIEGEVSEIPAFDELGAPIATLAIDTLDIPAYELTQAIAGRTDGFGIHFRGSLNVVESGAYTLCLTAASGALLFLDGTDVIDNDGAHEPKEECTDVEIDPGEYQLDLLWYHGTAEEVALVFTWAKDGGAKTVVPASALFPPEDAYSLARK